MNVSRYITYNANQWTYLRDISFDSLYKYKDDQWAIRTANS
jgi:hypothetical protein